MKNNIKRIISFTLIFVLTIILIPIGAVNASMLEDEVKADGMNVEAKSALLIEPTTGKVVYEKIRMKSLHQHL